MQLQEYPTLRQPLKLHLLQVVKLCRVWISKTFKKWRLERETLRTIRIMAELPDEILRDIGWLGALRDEGHSFYRHNDAKWR